jgi:hypothetical protein
MFTFYHIYFVILFIYFSEQIKNEFILSGSRGGKWGGVAQTMYTHVSKYKNDKNKRRGQKK